MTKILFVCHGNICRSTMAEYVFKHLVKLNGDTNFLIDSAATSIEEIGNPVHYGTRRELERHGIECGNHRARRMTAADYDNFDLLIGMDNANIVNMKRIAGGDSKNKIKKMLEFCGEHADVADPWYTGDFGTTYRDVLRGSEALYSFLQQNVNLQ